MLRNTLFLSLFVIFLFSIIVINCGNKNNWYKGNLHTHSFWSDGDDYPEMVMSWYKENGYDFMALSDHNILAEGDKWIDVNKSRGGIAAFEKYINKFGDDWIEQKEEDGQTMVRLKTLEEYRSLFEDPEKFLIIKSEELTDGFDNKPIHVNATNIQELIPPQGGNSIQEVMQNNIDAVNKQREAIGIPMFPHLNHPNFGWAITVEDMIPLKGEKFFEVYNGHPSVRNFGDELHPGTERMWDIVLSFRLSQGMPVMYGMAVDDAHNYHEHNSTKSNPGRGWVMVNADNLTPEAIIEAMEKGDFYASTGVVLEKIVCDEKQISIKIKSENGISYTTQFVGTKKGFDTKAEKIETEVEDAHISMKYSDEIGTILHETNGISATYQFKDDELYVRVKVISSKQKENPFSEGEMEVAWVQPVVLK
jgi:hypothetical protein